MSTSSFDTVMWTAHRHGQNWRDEESLAAINWLTSLVPAQQWERRIADAEATFQAAKSEWAQGRRVALFDPADTAAWYVHQAQRYADPALRPDFFEPLGFRIAPIFRRLGQLIPSLRATIGADERAERLMVEGRSQPDDGIYELLVAGAYKRLGWQNVEFVPEMPGAIKRPDLYVDRGRSHWAVECKRAGRSGYAREERAAGEAMADQVHQISRNARRAVAVIVRFTAELATLSSDYLAAKVAEFLNGTEPNEWHDEGGVGVVAEVPLRNLREVLRHDDIWFGSSRMVQLLLGYYDPSIDFSVGGDWTPAEGRPLHATSVEHVSLVVWSVASNEAARRKAQHFRGIVGRASEQLPGDRNGVIHVGYEALGGNSADGLRHHLNRREMRSFDPGESRLRMVYGNYFTPEHVTARNESAAVSETTAPYSVGGRRPLQPLAGHMLFGDENGLPGSHL